MSEVGIVVPTLGRPHALERLLESIEASTPADSFRVVFVIDVDDEPTRAKLYELWPRHPVFSWFAHDGTYPEKTNAGVRLCGEPLLFLTADDVVFRPRWFSAARARVREGVEVVGTVDLTPATVGRDHATMPLVTRDYITDPGAAFGEPGAAFHEGYHHNFCETELCRLAQHRGVWDFAEDSLVEHRHPSWGTAEMDDTYRRGAMTGWDDDATLFVEREALWAQQG